MGSFNGLIGWCVTTVISEVEKKKLSKTKAEGLMEKLKFIRGLFTEVCLENSRLTGAFHTSEEFRTKNIMSIFETAPERITAKNSENKELIARNKELEKQIENNNNEGSGMKPVPRPQPVVANKTYAMVTNTAKKPPISNKGKKAALEKCRNAKTTSRFEIEVPAEKSIAEAKTVLWKTVSAKIKNPRARTIVKGNTLIIVPDDNKTIEVLNQVPNVKVVEPRQPRIIIYDIDNEITVDDLAEGLQIQNLDLGLNKEDIGRICVMHKLGPRNGTTTHWVLETPPDVLAKLENKSVFLCMTKCRLSRNNF